MTVGQRLIGTVALITGGASGIGAKTARVFAEHGAGVAVSDVNDDLGRQVADEIEAKGGDAAYFHLDTTDEEQWIAVVRQTIGRFSKLNVLVNVAGVSGREADRKTVPKIDGTRLDLWNAVMSVNATGVFLGIKHVIRPMREAGGGSIINMSSIYGIVGSAHSAAYHASKGAVRLLTKCAAIQYAGEKIRVNSVHPGFVDTPMTELVHADPELAGPRLAATPVGRFGQPYDIAMGCLYLASDEAAWMTGAELVIDGGMTAQ
ncbi:MAG: SDR family NAD(P)-dependent oxidoreductase [Kiloniellales bacterium]